MYTILTVLIILICVLIILVVLIQNPKGGGLSSTFGGGAANQIMGAQKSGDFFEKATWGLAIVLLAFSILTAFFVPVDNQQNNNSSIQEQIDNAPSQGLPTAPTPTVPEGGAPN